MVWIFRCVWMSLPDYKFNFFLRMWTLPCDSKSHFTLHTSCFMPSSENLRSTLWCLLVHTPNQQYSSSSQRALVNTSWSNSRRALRFTVNHNLQQCMFVNPGIYPKEINHAYQIDAWLDLIESIKYGIILWSSSANEDTKVISIVIARWD